MKNLSPQLQKQLELSREPKNQLDFLIMIGMFRIFDAPFILGIVVSPGWLWWIVTRSDWRWLTVIVTVYVMWLVIVVFRCIYFVVTCIGAVKDVEHNAARLAASYLTGKT